MGGASAVSNYDARCEGELVQCSIDMHPNLNPNPNLNTNPNPNHKPNPNPNP